MKKQTLSLGMIGMSEGNGHPYSWSAIFNGYDKKELAACPFPAIRTYLSNREFPRDSISNAKITHVWTQDASQSRHIADFARIPHVADEWRDLVKAELDGILVARDDFENHAEMAQPFLEAGIPVYVDKPFAISTEAARSLFQTADRCGAKVFTCSALRFSLELDRFDPSSLGSPLFIHGTVMKSWEKYAIHLLDPICRLTPSDVDWVQYHGQGTYDLVSIGWKNGTLSDVAVLGDTACPISLSFYGTRGCKTILLEDTFTAFKRALESFVDYILTGRNPISRDQTLQVIRILEAGIESRKTLHRVHLDQGVLS